MKTSGLFFIFGPGKAQAREPDRALGSARLLNGALLEHSHRSFSVSAERDAHLFDESTRKPGRTLPLATSTTPK